MRTEGATAMRFSLGGGIVPQNSHRSVFAPLLQRLLLSRRLSFALCAAHKRSSGAEYELGGHHPVASFRSNWKSRLNLAQALHSILRRDI